ncbi:hypothetical protein ACTMU2_37915 [Cupriavidus basilensis]
MKNTAAHLRLDRVRDAATRGAVQDLAYRTMRQFGTARALGDAPGHAPARRAGGLAARCRAVAAA